MPEYIVTPWRTQADLLKVRSQLYRLDNNSQDDRTHAVARVMAWRLRGHLPHAVESTALLIDAFLHHDIAANSSFSIRAVYSAAFCRFVTGFCDIGRNRERSLEPSSMLVIARQIGMPEGFVALRHEATHQELPGEQRIVAACEEALQWLWRVYWSRLDSDVVKPVASSAVRTEDCVELAQKLFREYRSAKRTALKKPKVKSTELDKALSSVNELVDSCGERAKVLQMVTNDIVAKDWLIPADRQAGASMDGAFMLWEDLLLRLCSVQPGFVKSLVEGFMSVVCNSKVADNRREAYAEWLVQVGSSSIWEFARQTSAEDVAAAIMKECCLHPDRWTSNVVASLLEAGDEAFAETWSYLVEAMGLAADTNEEQDASPADTLIIETAAPAAGWYRAIMSPVTPIGVVA